MRWWKQRSLPVRVLLVLVVLAVVGLELHLWLIGYEGETSTAALAGLGYILFPMYGFLLIVLVLVGESAVRVWRARFANRFVEPF